MCPLQSSSTSISKGSLGMDLLLDVEPVVCEQPRAALLSCGRRLHSLVVSGSYCVSHGLVLAVKSAARQGKKDLCLQSW